MIFFVILILLSCLLLGLIILVQNPKGGGLAANVGGFSNQFMGVKQTTDVLEKGTWLLAIVVALLCLFSTVFIPKNTSTQVRDVKPSATSLPMNANPGPATTTPAPGNQQPPKK
ncbi:MAG TPA: preprotein translocase subunit SecG [Puia sp.]|jgi:preprotein translocase subunit SecG|nr:preprotein translocase subunit SecG [Puia sp.]